MSCVKQCIIKKTKNISRISEAKEKMNQQNFKKKKKIVGFLP